MQIKAIEDDDIRTSDIIRAVSGEVLGLDDLCADLEIGVLSILETSNCIPKYIEKLQAIDRVRQGLHEIAKLTEALADELGEIKLPGPAAAQILSSIVQTSTRNRMLLLLADSTNPADDPSKFGDVTFF